MQRSPLLLLIEDEIPIAQILKQTLEGEGFKLITANDGDVGLKAAVDSHPDLILLDILMPRMDGLVMLKKLRENEWGKDAKVIILTNLSNPVSERAAKDLNANAYIIKSDWYLSDIVKKIKQVLETL